MQRHLSWLQATSQDKPLWLLSFSHICRMLAVLQKAIIVHPGECVWIASDQLGLQTTITLEYVVTLNGRIAIYLLEPKALLGKARQKHFWQIPVKELLKIATVCASTLSHSKSALDVVQSSVTPQSIKIFAEGRRSCQASANALLLLGDMVR